MWAWPCIRARTGVLELGPKVSECAGFATRRTSRRSSGFRRVCHSEIARRIVGLIHEWVHDGGADLERSLHHSVRIRGDDMHRAGARPTGRAALAGPGQQHATALRPIHLTVMDYGWTRARVPTRRPISQLAVLLCAESRRAPRVQRDAGVRRSATALPAPGLLSHPMRSRRPTGAVNGQQRAAAAPSVCLRLPSAATAVGGKRLNSRQFRASPASGSNR